jgi:predicted phage-related endonuclease
VTANISPTYRSGCVPLPVHKHGSEAWLIERGNTIGASEVGMVIGVSPYGGLLELVQRKRAALAGNVEQNDSPAMADGRDAEDTILRMARRRIGAPHLKMRTGEAVAIGRASATPDAILIDEDNVVIALVEAKLDRSRTDWSTVADGNFSDLQPGDLRLTYWWQVQQQLRVTGCASGWLAVWTVYEFHLIYIEADAEAAATIDKAIAAAWKWVAHPKGLLPAPTDADSLAAIAASIKPKSEEPKQVDGDLADDIARYVAIGKQVDELEAEQSAIKRRLLIAHADAAALVTADGFKSSFVAATSRRSVDTKRLQAERPDVAEEFTRTTEVSAGCRVTAPRAKKV